MVSERRRWPPNNADGKYFSRRLSAFENSNRMLPGMAKPARDREEQRPGTAPLEAALSEGLLTAADLLRLKAIARLQARGLPGSIEWVDLLHDAMVRLLQGSRRRPPELGVVPFVAGIMRSLRAEHWARLRREASGRSAAELLAHPPPDPEQRLMAIEALAELDRLFADDARALEVLAGLAEGLSADAIRIAYGMSQTEYESTRKRMRRALLREGLARRWG